MCTVGVGVGRLTSIVQPSVSVESRSLRMCSKHVHLKILRSCGTNETNELAL